MTVRANKDALTRLLSIGVERLPSGHRNPERLVLGIDVMEVEVHHRPVIATNGATTASLLDQDSLHLLVSAGDGLSDASFALPSRSLAVDPIKAELSRPVTPALPHLDWTASIGIRRAPGVLEQRDRRLQVGINPTLLHRTYVPFPAGRKSAAAGTPTRIFSLKRRTL